MINPSLLSDPGLYPLCGTVSVESGMASSGFESTAEYYCNSAGEYGYGLFLTRRPVVTCRDYDGLTGGNAHVLAMAIYH